MLRAGSVIAVWGYHIPMVGETAIDAAIRHFHDEVVGPYWPPERQLVLDRFTSIDFPFDELAAPDFEMRCAWTLDDFAAYLGTQSATDRYRRAHGRRPGPRFVARSRASWGGRDRFGTSISRSSCAPAALAVITGAVRPTVGPMRNGRREQIYEDLR